MNFDRRTPARNLRLCLCLALLAGEALWGLLAACGPATRQERVFCCQGKAWFLDYQAPREWAVAAKHYHPENAGRWDISCYPPINYDFVKLFPRGRIAGGLLMAASATLALALAVLFLAQKLKTPCPPAATALVVFSAPSLFCFSTGNSLPFAVAGCCLFFAWKDETGLRHFLALLALAAAIALKVTPVFFALPLLTERRGRDLLFVGLVSAALVFLPFAWYGGISEFRDFLACLRIRGDYYGIRDSWGFVGLDRCLRLGLGMDVESVRTTYPLTRTLNVLFATGCLLSALYELARPKDPQCTVRAMTLLAIALIMLPGGSVFYNSLYLVPAFLMTLASPSASTTVRAAVAAFAWFLLFIPLQIPVSFSSANIPLAALAILLLGFALAVPWPRKGSRAGQA